MPGPGGTLADPAPMSAPVDAARLEADADAWDRHVEGAPLGSYLQLSAWAGVKARNDWTATRLAVDAPDGPTGVQVLVRRPRPLPWGFAYAPRGPVFGTDPAASLEPLTARLRDGLRSAVGRVSHLRIDPEVEREGPLDPDGRFRDALAAAGWRPAPPIQPDRTRVIDLRADEASLWSDLRKKWRQYVNRARSLGVRVVEADEARLPAFYRIYRETAERAGFHIRTEASYRAVWDAYRPAGRASLLFAETAEGEPVATLFLLRCGARVVEPYGGMTALGADTRANYLLKWEAIRSSRAAGATTYDLWGLAHPGIAHFKTGFGGREVAYVGAWDLVIDGLGRRTYAAAQRVRIWQARRSLRRSVEPGAGGEDA
jgi:peptidoglycan pentaglycine glycine transferase (the first glycine)